MAESLFTLNPKASSEKKEKQRGKKEKKWKKPQEKSSQKKRNKLSKNKRSLRKSKWSRKRRNRETFKESLENNKKANPRPKMRFNHSSQVENLIYHCLREVLNMKLKQPVRLERKRRRERKKKKFIRRKTLKIRKRRSLKSIRKVIRIGVRNFNISLRENLTDNLLQFTSTSPKPKPKTRKSKSGKSSKISSLTIMKLSALIVEWLL